MTLPLPLERHDRPSGVMVANRFQRSCLCDAKHPQRHMKRPSAIVDADHVIADIVFWCPLNEWAKVRKHHVHTSRQHATRRVSGARLHSLIQSVMNRLGKHSPSPLSAKGARSPEIAHPIFTFRGT